jgi:membrane-associated phospholipid phosphatase
MNCPTRRNSSWNWTKQHLDEQAGKITQKLARMSHQKPWADDMLLLMQLPGFGVVTGITVLAAIGDITRFASPKHLAGYSGLVPGLEQSGTKKRGKAADRLAKVVSGIFHPFLVVIPTMVVAMLREGSTIEQSILWTILVICVVILPLLFLVYRGVRSGRYSDPSISIREQRHSLYLVAEILLLLLLAALLWGRAPTILVACLISAILVTLIASLINYRFTKLSLHSIGMAGCITVLILTIPVLGFVMALFAPVVGWARIRLKHHTPFQILLGWAVSAICVLIVFRFFHIGLWIPAYLG